VGLRVVTVLLATLSVLSVTAIVAASDARVTAAPTFFLPFRCGEAGWFASTRDNHVPSIYAIDFNKIRDEEEQQVVASADGEIVYPAYNKESNPLAIDHDGGGWRDGWATLYLHMKVARTSGRVKRGEVIGYVSNLGSTDKHLHYEQRFNSITQSARFNNWMPSYDSAMKQGIGVQVPTSDNCSASQYAGHIVKWSGETPTPVTSWYVTSDLRRLWIPDGGTYNCFKARGAPGPTLLSASILDQLPDQSGRWAACGDSMTTSRTLRRGMYLQSGDGRYRLQLQLDGNFVLYGPSGRALWANGVFSTRYIVLQADGNLVGYTDSNTATWSTRTNGSGATLLRVQNDGNVVLYAGSRAVWSTGTYGKT